MYIDNFTNQLTKFIVATVSKQYSITDKVSFVALKMIY